MPYIDREARNNLNPIIDNLLEEIPLVLGRDVKDGDVNYLITRIIDSFYGMGGYAKFNRAIGILECVKHELYRRVVAPYEDIKRNQNGDVYG